MESVKEFTKTAFNELSSKAALSARRRAHMNVHANLDDPVQRLFIGLEPDTYIRPHRHSGQDKWEFLMVIQGALDTILFDDAGVIIAKMRLGPQHSRAVQIPSGTWHSYVCLETETIAFEVREGPYIPVEPSDLAPWSPADDPEAEKRYLDWMRSTAPIG
jgi:cupin fold WbuC family metalloprotein